MLQTQTTYDIDQNQEEVLLSDQNQQVMMEWEKPYMFWMCVFS
jgi:hypothetical protein